MVSDYQKSSHELILELNQLREEVQDVYQERNQLVRLLSCIFPAYLGEHGRDGWPAEFDNVVYIMFPNGQASWHIHESELRNFSHLSKNGPDWDGHTTDQKYQIIEKLGARMIRDKEERKAASSTQKETAS